MITRTSRTSGLASLAIIGLAASLWTLQPARADTPVRLPAVQPATQAPDGPCAQLAAQTSASTGPRRLALVVANTAYAHAGSRIGHGQADVSAISNRLTSLGFSVMRCENLGQRDMREWMASFSGQVRKDDFALIYYVGEAVERPDGRDFLLPVDATLNGVADLKLKAIALDDLYPAASFGTLVVLDAGREPPLTAPAADATPAFAVGVRAVSPPPGVMVIYASSESEPAPDGGATSPFATAFLKALDQPGASVDRVFQTLAKDVRTARADHQSPQRFGVLEEDFVFNAATPTPAVQLAAAPPPEPAHPAAVEPAVAVAAAAAPPPGPEEAAAVADQTPPTPQTSSQDAPAPATVEGLTPAISADGRMVYVGKRPVALTAEPQPETVPQQVKTTLPAGGHFTLASLGENVLPPAPELESLPDVSPPTAFCSDRAKLDFLERVHKPAYAAALRNNDAASAYLGGLNQLAQEYDARTSPFAYMVRDRFRTYEPIARDAYGKAGALLQLDQVIRDTPLGRCTAATAGRR